jgi:hypothetical protein
MHSIKKTSLLKRKTQLGYSAVLVVFCFFLFGCRTEPNPEIAHIVHMGQSLGAGEHSTPVVTQTGSAFGNLSFKIGTHTWTKDYFPGEPERRSNDSFDLVPLRAYERGHEGETIGSGLCDHLSQTSDSIVKRTRKTKYLFSYSGEGGRLIRELDKRHNDANDTRAGERLSGGRYYATAIDDVRRAKHICDSLEWKYSVFALTWMQGESNRMGQVNRWDPPLRNPDSIRRIYINDLIQLKKDFQEDIRSITGQKNKPHLFTYQTEGPLISTAQVMACDLEKDIHMVGPIYMLPNAGNSRIYNTNAHGDDIHLTADGERWLGEMFAKVIRKVVLEKKNWQPLRPLKALLKEDEIRVRFFVPAPPLVIDTIFLPAEGTSLGFDIYDSYGQLDVKAVRLNSENELVIKLKKKPDPGRAIHLAYGGRSYVRELSLPLKNIKSATSVNDSLYVVMEFASDISDELHVIAKEGCFGLAKIAASPEESAKTVVRRVKVNAAGNTELICEKKDFVGAPFNAGDRLIIYRRYGFGNIRDSDAEISTYRFSDKTYGNRAGQNYPLFNWLITFEDFSVELQ